MIKKDKEKTFISRIYSFIIANPELLHFLLEKNTVVQKTEKMDKPSIWINLTCIQLILTF